MAASIGTLSAKLVLDSSGFSGGFAKASNVVAGFGSKMPKFGQVAAIAGRAMSTLGASSAASITGIAGASAALGPVGIGLGVAAAAAIGAGLAIRSVSQSLDEMDKRFLSASHAAERMKAVEQTVKGVGAALTDRDKGAVIQYGDEVAKLGGIFAGIKEKFSATLAPVFTGLLEMVRGAVEGISEFLGDLGISWDTVAKAAQIAGGIMAAALKTVFGLAQAVGSSILMLVGKFDEAAKLRDKAFGNLKAGMGRDAFVAFGKRTDAIRNRGTRGFGIGGPENTFGLPEAPKTQTAFERGTREAAVAVAAMNGNPIKTLSEQMQELIDGVKRVKDEIANQPVPVNVAVI